MKPLASNQRRTKVETCDRANSPQRRSANLTEFQKGRATGELKGHRGRKHGIQANADWPLAPKSVWFATQPPTCNSTDARYLAGKPCPEFRGPDVRVIASSIRKGNIIERDDGQLCVVLSAESFHPGKGTPTTQIDMRRLSDGVKVSERYKTTEQVERAFVEDRNFDFLYSDADGYHFMNADTYDQIQVSAGVIGDQAQWLQEGMKVILSMFNGSPVAIQLPPRVTLEVIETEPAMKGQTASSSYKPAKLANGARAMVPPHISVGVRIVIQTEDGSYVERAKD
jgi:elongation factor P